MQATKLEAIEAKLDFMKQQGQMQIDLSQKIEKLLGQKDEE